MSEAKKVLEQAIERWNATDRDGWAALYTDDVVYEATGGARISGLADLKEKYFDASGLVGEQAIITVQDLVTPTLFNTSPAPERRNRQSVAVQLMSLCAGLERGLSWRQRRTRIGTCAGTRVHPVLFVQGTSS